MIVVCVGVWEKEMRDNKSEKRVGLTFMLKRRRFYCCCGLNLLRPTVSKQETGVCVAITRHMDRYPLSRSLSLKTSYR